MPRQCIFCNNPADTAEHLFADWILCRVTPRSPLYARIGKHKQFKKNEPEMTTRRVCSTCNPGWMSDLENKSLPILEPMLRDRPLELDYARQNTLAKWLTKTVMVFESVTMADRKMFYTKHERHSLRKKGEIPEITNIWIARYEQSSLGCYGTDLGVHIEYIPKRVRCFIATVILGHLAMQILVAHINPKYRDRPFPIPLADGDWESSLVKTWPIFGNVHWPPRVSFGGRELPHVSELHSRWKVGKEL